MKNDLIRRLAAANPVPHGGPLRALEAQGHGRRRRRLTLGIVIAAGVIGVVLVATPAWALVRDVLPFWDQPSAPPRVIVQFSEEAMGYPTASPRPNPRSRRSATHARSCRPTSGVRRTRSTSRPARYSRVLRTPARGADAIGGLHAGASLIG